MNLIKIFLIIFFSTLCTVTKGEKPIVLNTKNNTYETSSLNKFVTICKNPNKKSLDRIWRTAFFEINSTTQCSIYDAIKIEEMENTRDTSYYLHLTQKALSKLMDMMVIKSDDNERYYQTVYVETFKNHCIGIEPNGGSVQVTLHYKNFDLNLMAIFLFGFILFTLARPISKNVYFYYTSGISLGVIGSLLILLIIAAKYIPKKSTALAVIVGGGSIIGFTLRWITLNFKSAVDSFQVYFLYYISASVLISWAYCYYRGPIQNPRAHFLIEILLRVVGGILIYFGTSYKEIAILCFITIFSVKILHLFLNSTAFSFLSYKLFPPKRRLLTQDEYIKESHEYTAKALKELRDYCRSPECNSWKVVSKIKNPDRFARFVETNESHITDHELSAYENYTINNDLIDEEIDLTNSVCTNNNDSY